MLLDYGKAFGIMISIFSHTGRGFGFVNNLEWYPENNIGIIVFTNKYDQKNTDIEISHKIIDKILEKRKNNEFLEIQKIVYGDYISSMSNLKIQKSVKINSIHLIGDINYGSFGNSIKKVDLILNYIGKNKFKYIYLTKWKNSRNTR